ncbi:hypothetical protein RN001_004363 [Aquatica leii]|uniref:Chitin-binding type-2 domain-containing protein n=1 Tax=Aquatica leii TaxID=1421715 RepID=A0AAN7PYD4_9COLE|nr:hypothetical protein RN001_004363 [Aquatica leii]
MLRIFLFFALLACGKAQGQGYDYNRPVKPFAQSSTTGTTFQEPYSQNGAGTGYPSTRPVDSNRITATPGGQIQPNQQSAQHFPSSDQYQHHAQTPDSSLSKYPEQTSSFPGYDKQQPHVESQFPESRPSAQFPETKPSSQFSQPRPISQFSGARPSSQYPETRPSSQFPGARPSSQFSETGPSPQFPETKPSSQFPETRPSSQFPGARPSSQFPETRPSSQFPGTKPSSQFPETGPSSQFPGTRPSSQFSETGPSPQFPETKPISQFPETRPSSQFSGTRPSSQFSETGPSLQFPETKPISQFPETRPSSQFPGTRPSSQFSETRPSSQFPGGRPTSQFSGTRPTPQLPQTKPSGQFSDYEAPGSTPQFNKAGVSNLGNGLSPEAFHDEGQYRGDEDGDYSAIPGEPEVDYPIYSNIPETAFKCEEQQYPGYYADVETRCQVFHICANNKMYDFLCPNGTVFHQEYLVCVWWNQFDCNSAPSLYGINAHIYDYSHTDLSQHGLGSQNRQQFDYTPKSETSSVSDYPSSSRTPQQTKLQPRPQNIDFQDYSQQETTPSYSGFTPSKIPKGQSSQVPVSKFATQQLEDSYPQSQPQGSPFTASLQPQKQTLAYPQTNKEQPQSSVFNVPQSSPGYPEPFASQRQQQPGYATSKYPKPQEGAQELAHSLNGLASSRPSTEYSKLQPDSSAFPSPNVGYSETQTSSYPKSSTGAVTRYPNNQLPTTITKPSQTTTSYPKSQTPLSRFPTTDFSSSAAYHENDQSPGYPAPSKPTLPFFGDNDIEQQRQYLPPTNG